MYKTNESGRSMVEMLGVLAIIGVLSVGGVAGFNLAMNKHCANNTVVYVNQLAVQGTSQMLMGVKPSLGQYPDKTPSGYPSALTTEETNPNAFYVKISQVPSAVCNQILGLQKGWQTVNDIGFYNGATTCDDKENVDMWFEIVLGETIKQLHCITDNDCQSRLGTTYTCNTTRGICEGGHCPTGQVATSSGCCPTYDVLEDGICCQIGPKKDSNGNRVCCWADWSIPSETAGYTNICCPSGYFVNEGKCIPCDDQNVYYGRITGGSSRRNYCQVCPNRVQNDKHGCALKCTDSNSIVVDGICRCPMDKPLMSSDRTGRCLPCSYTKETSDIPPYGLAEYDKISFMTYSAHLCNRSNHSGYSYYCAPGKVGISATETIKRKVNGEWVDITMSGGSGECIPCEELDISALKYQAQCESCGGHWDGENWYTGVCVPKETD